MYHISLSTIILREAGSNKNQHIYKNYQKVVLGEYDDVLKSRTETRLMLSFQSPFVILSRLSGRTLGWLRGRGQFRMVRPDTK